MTNANGNAALVLANAVTDLDQSIRIILDLFATTQAANHTLQADLTAAVTARDTFQRERDYLQARHDQLLAANIGLAQQLDGLRDALMRAVDLGEQASAWDVIQSLVQDIR